MEGDQSTNSTQNIQKILLYFLQFSAILIGLYYAVLILIAFSGDFILLIQFIHIATGIVTSIFYFIAKSSLNRWFKIPLDNLTKLTITVFLASSVFFLFALHFVLYGGWIFSLPYYALKPLNNIVNFLRFPDKMNIFLFVIGIIQFIVLFFVAINLLFRKITKNGNGFLPKYFHPFFLFVFCLILYPAILALMCVFPISYWAWVNRSKKFSVSKIKIVGLLLVILICAVFPLYWSRYLVKKNYQISYNYEYLSGMDRNPQIEMQIFDFDFNLCNVENLWFQTIKEQLAHYEEKIAKMHDDSMLQFNDYQYRLINFHLIGEILGNDTFLVFNRTRSYLGNCGTLNISQNGEKIISEEGIGNYFIFLNCSIFTVSDIYNFSLNNLEGLILFQITIKDSSYIASLAAHWYMFHYIFLCDISGNIGFVAYSFGGVIS